MSSPEARFSTAELRGQVASGSAALVQQTRGAWWSLWFCTLPQSLPTRMSRTSPMTSFRTPASCRAFIPAVVSLCSMSRIWLSSFLSCRCLDRISLLQRLPPFFFRAILAESFALRRSRYRLLERSSLPFRRRGKPKGLRRRVLPYSRVASARRSAINSSERQRPSR